MLSNYLAEEYFEKIKPEVNLVSSYLEDNDIKEIIIKCRLKPYKYNYSLNRKLILRRHWVDEFNNSFILDEKKIKIIENDLSLTEKDVKYTDLYYGLPINKIIKISKLLHISIGKDEDFNQDCCVLTFLGIDNYLRTFALYNGKVERRSPLCLGIKNLKKIINNTDVKIYNKLPRKERVIYPCSYWDEWIVSLPVHSIFWKEKNLNKEILNNLGVC